MNADIPRERNAKESAITDVKQCFFVDTTRNARKTIIKYSVDTIKCKK